MSPGSAPAPIKLVISLIYRWQTIALAQPKPTTFPHSPEQLLVPAAVFVCILFLTSTPCELALTSPPRSPNVIAGHRGPTTNHVISFLHKTTLHEPVNQCSLYKPSAINPFPSMSQMPTSVPYELPISAILKSSMFWT